jgi:ribosome biogenesis GTPase
VDAEARRAEVQRLAGGAEVLVVCAQTAEGIARLAALTAGGRTLALVGSSGAGKSTIVNGLVGYDRQRTAAVREDDARGRHTTTVRELLPLAGGGALIDTPGMRELQLWAGEESVEGTFDDIASLARLCRFRDCGHAAENGCAVRAALEAGSLDPDRWRNYLKLRSEIAWHALRTDMGAAMAEKRRWKKIHKSLRQHHKQR